MVFNLHNRSFLLWGLLFLCSSMFMTNVVQAQTSGTIKGNVAASGTKEPLLGANVSIVGTTRGSSTNLEGFFSFKIKSGAYMIRASFIGYDTVEKSIIVIDGDEVTVNFQLAEGVVEFRDVVIEVGSRTSRTALETPVPVDVLSEIDIRRSGATEINQIISTLAPSFNASHQTISDGTDHINPASLRGLGPDQVLVLINGKRRHSSSLVHVNGTFGRGTVGVDLNAIPKSAIKRIEVLRDGAAAQYGSDAIAGVINIVLKHQTDELQINTQSGGTGEGDGEQFYTSANYGFKIGETGFLNVTGEFLDRGRTNRSDTYTGTIFTPNGDGLTSGGNNIPDISDDETELSERGLTRDDFTMKTGQSDATVGSVFLNSAVPLKDGSEFYASGGLSHRNGVATGFFRLPRQEERVNYNIYPNGFLPEIHTQIQDDAFTLGLRGTRNGWDVDLSVTHGGNAFQYNIENSMNASLGASSPTSFDAGRLKFRQTTGNLDLVRLIDTQGEVKSLSFVAGTEFRIDNYEIQAGDEASYITGSDTTSIVLVDADGSGRQKNSGSQIFPGFQPSNEVNRFRNSISAYAGFESQVTEKLMADLSGRYENYSDFGSTVIGKLAARFEPADRFALRGALSSGFRAPSLHQFWFNNVSIQFVDEGGVLVSKRVLTGNNNSAVAKAFGIPALKEEKSFNFSTGFTARPTSKLSITTDFYYIELDDRIVLSSRFADSDPIVAAILEPFEQDAVSQAQFFVNAVDTETKGLDIVAAYDTELGEAQMTLTGAINLTKTEVVNVNIPEEITNKFASGDLDAVKNTLFNREEQNRLEDALPRQKFTVSAQYNLNKFSALVRSTYFGAIEYHHPTNPDNDERFSGKGIVDVDLSYEIFTGVKVAAGANNIFNTFPDKQTKEGNISSGRFPFSRRVTQFGTNGGFYYGRLQLSL